MVYEFKATRWIYPKGCKGIIKSKDDVVVSTISGEIYDDGLTKREVLAKIKEQLRGWKDITLKPQSKIKND